MKKGMKLLVAGAVAAAVGLFAYKKYQDSYEQVVENEIDHLGNEDDDFVVIDEIDDGFDYVMVDEEQIMFYE